MTLQKTSPPSWPGRLLKRLCTEEQLEILYGDVEEVFYRRLEQGGKFKAKLLFYRDAFSLLRPFALKKAEEYHPTLNYLHMLKIHFKSSLRSLRKNPLSSYINIFGLTVGMTAVLLIAQYAMFELNYDKFHERADDIYRVSFNRSTDNQVVFNAATIFLPVGPEIQKAFPEVENQVRFYYPFTHGEIKYGDESFNEEKPVFTDPSYFDVFSYPLKSGNPKTALSEPNKVVFSEELALRYFGNEEAIGKLIEFSFEDGETTLQVTGVLESPRKDSHLRLNMLISISTLDQWPTFERSKWALPFYHTYVLFNQKPDVAAFEFQASELVRGFRAASTEKNVVESIALQRLRDIHLDSDLTFELFENGDRQSVNLIILVASMILLIAYLNYINLATARSVKRAKEVGVRKILGSRKRQLIHQFLTESFMLNFAALAFAILGMSVLVPFFSELLARDFHVTRDPIFWGATFLFVIVGCLVSGLYPAFVLSSYQPISVLRGNFSNSIKGSLLRRVLVTFQFIVAVAMIGGTMLLLGQTNFLMNKDLGFAAEQVMVVNAPRTAQNTENYLSLVRAFAGRAQNLPNVNNFTHSGSIPGKVMASGMFQKKGDVSGEPSSMQLNTTDFGYFETYGLEFLSGRGFDKDIMTDRTGLIINEAAMRALRFENAEQAINSKVIASGNDREYNILGVVSNYHHSSLKKSYEPIIFAFMPDRTIYFSFNVNTDAVVNTVASIEALMLEMFPESPFEYNFLDDAFDAEFKSELRFADIFKSFSLLSILLGGLGLFGLASFAANQKVKEISIRKVLGASLGDILRLLASTFTPSFIIGSLMAWVLLYFGGMSWLDNYAFRINLQWQFFMIPVIFVLALAILTIGFQALRATKAEPAQILRNND